MQQRLTSKLILVCATAAVGGFLFGYDTSVINGAVSALASPDSGFGLSSFLSGFSVSCALIGCIGGAWFAGPLADRFGRVRVMQAAAVLFVLSAVASGFAPGFGLFVLARILGGVGVGFTSAIGPAYISEISPVARRGFLAGFQQLAITLGITASLIVNDIYATSSGGAAEPFWGGADTWRWMLVTTAVPGLIMFFLAFTLPESPRYLVMRGERSRAVAILREVTGEADPERTVSLIAATVQSEAGRKPRLSDLRGRTFGLKQVVWVGIGIAIFQQVSGCSVIMFYDSSLWQMVGLSEQVALHASVIRSLLTVIVTIVGMLLIDRLGRRKLLRVGSIWMAVFLIVIAVGFSQSSIGADGSINLPGPWAVIVIASMYTFFLLYCASWGVAMWVVIGEIFPNNIRALGVALATAANWVGNFAVTTSFPPLRDSIGLSVTYIIYAAMALLGYVFVRKFLPETSGVSLENMQAEGALSE